MQKKNLLVISSGFPDESGEYLAHTFVKGYVDEARHYYQSIIVLVLRPYVPNLLNRIINKGSNIVNDYSYGNVQVKYKSYPYIPVWPLSRIKGKIAFLFLSNSIMKMIGNNTIIHANFTSPSGVFANFLSKKIDENYILTVHEDHDWLTQEINEKNKLLIDTWKNAKKLIRVNNLDNAILSQFNKNVITIPNGFNHRKFKAMNKDECKRKLSITGNKKTIVNIGFYKEQKNQKLLIEAINLLPSKVKKNLTCFIIGGGPKYDELVNLTESYNLQNTVHIIGQIRHEKLPLYLNVSDIFCLSSNSEGNPTVMFEALGVGIPYVGTNIGGVPEIITSDKYGLLCQPNDKQALKEIIEEGLNKNWNTNEIIEYGSSYSWKNIFLETQQYY